jgi:hypothetical protein
VKTHISMEVWFSMILIVVLFPLTTADDRERLPTVNALPEEREATPILLRQLIVWTSVHQQS